MLPSSMVAGFLMRDENQLAWQQKRRRPNFRQLVPNLRHHPIRISVLKYLEHSTWLHGWQMVLVMVSWMTNNVDHCNTMTNVEMCGKVWGAWEGLVMVTQGGVLKSWTSIKGLVGFPFVKKLCWVSCEVVSLSSFACSEFLLLASFYSENQRYRSCYHHLPRKCQCFDCDLQDVCTVGFEI